MQKEYGKQEIRDILQGLQIAPIEGMIDSQQAARVMSKRAEIETGETHSYGNDAVRWRVRSEKLKIARTVNSRLNLFLVDDVFSLNLQPNKWHSKQTRPSRKGIPSTRKGKKLGTSKKIS